MTRNERQENPMDHQAAWIVYFILVWLALLIVPRLLLKKAMVELIRRFRDHHSLCSETPKTVTELGLKLRGFRIIALQTLYKAGAIRYFEGERLCLLEHRVPEFLDRTRVS
jgi:hypothetical protein